MSQCSVQPSLNDTPVKYEQMDSMDRYQDWLLDGVSFKKFGQPEVVYALATRFLVKMEVLACPIPP